MLGFDDGDEDNGDNEDADYDDERDDEDNVWFNQWSKLTTS
jgi:hypothetical protein